ncbi:helix-turn-helix domain-containing protein [Cupriavidus sp. D39]|uniref:helix-turn-helix domain-containing protein n=1 Tax=Cupriavidus sp. D39 TaxID=2997877 RepID=UPI00226FB436|nr:helix-turn-helix domain-containing protein [Cupriavidus sp. D39]MCY0856051.1 helix-turn-helix domain-containing protein [Cupriavidus sp. D39]
MNSPETPLANPQKKEELLDSLTNGLALLRLFASGAGSLTMQDVAEQLDVTRAAARRLLLTLQHNGYVAQDGRDFSITPRVMDLGYAYFASMNLPQLAGPYLKALSEQAGKPARWACSTAKRWRWWRARNRRRSCGSTWA